MFTEIIAKFNVAPTEQPNGTFVLNGEHGHVVITRHDMTDDIIELWVNRGDDLYRWINIEYASEEEERKMFTNHEEKSYNVSSYDELAFQDIVDKATAIINGTEFNDDVVITVEMDNDLKSWIEKHCEENEITVSEFFEMAIERVLVDYK